MDWPPVAGAAAFTLQVCTLDPSVEANGHYGGMATKSSTTLTTLPAGKIWVRVCAKGSNDLPGPFSDPEEEMVR